MTIDKKSQQSGQQSLPRRAFISLTRVPFSAVIGFVSAAAVALLAAYWGGKYAIAEQRAMHVEHAAALKEVIRVEAVQNLKNLTKSTMNLRTIQKSLKTYVEGDGPAPPIGPGYLRVATVGLRLQLESPSAFYIPHGVVAMYGSIYGRLTVYEEVRRDLNADVIAYAAAFTSAEKRRIAATLFFRIEQQLDLAEALVSQEGGLSVFLACLDQFSMGADECNYTPSGTSDAVGTIRPPQPER